MSIFEGDWVEHGEGKAHSRKLVRPEGAYINVLDAGKWGIQWYLWGGEDEEAAGSAGDIHTAKERAERAAEEWAARITKEN